MTKLKNAPTVEERLIEVFNTRTPEVHPYG